MKKNLVSMLVSIVLTLILLEVALAALFKGPSGDSLGASSWDGTAHTRGWGCPVLPGHHPFDDDGFQR